MPRVATSEVHACAGKGAEERQAVGRHVNRAAPYLGQAYTGQRRQEAAQSGFGPGGARGIEAQCVVVSAPSVADRPGARSHEHAAIACLSEIVQEHSQVGNAFAAGPDAFQRLARGISHECKA